MSTAPDGFPAAGEIGVEVPWAALDRWILDQGGDVPGTGPLTGAVALRGGSQNVLLGLRRDGAELVLRRPPVHPRANSFETIGREVHVLRALDVTDVPHPRVFAWSPDPGIIGTPFYLMQAIDGFTPSGELPPGYDAPARRAMAFDLVDAAARLAAVDPVAVGLADFGKAERWAERQVDRWGSQFDGYAALGYSPALDIERVARWLSANIPARSRIGVIHGDLQWANTMFARTRPELLAIVDWELSTLGDPLLDLGWILTAWTGEEDPPGHTLQVSTTEGMPTRDELVTRYCRAAGREPSEAHWYFVLACYKLGVILEGTYARALAGKATAEMGKLLHDYALWLFAKAEQLVDGPAR